jgi:hypothetical protein
MGAETRQLYQFGPFRIGSPGRRLLRNTEVVPLKPKVFETLALACGERRPGSDEGSTDAVDLAAHRG